MHAYSALLTAVLVLCVLTSICVADGAPDNEFFCDSALCLNDTYANITNRSYAMQPYRDCVANAGGITAFECRCTPRVYECLINRSLANCHKRFARSYCWRFITNQAKGCSQRLCKAAAAPTGVGLLTMVVGVVVAVVGSCIVQ